MLIYDIKKVRSGEVLSWTRDPGPQWMVEVEVTQNNVLCIGGRGREYPS